MKNLHSSLVMLVTMFVLLISTSAFADVACPAGGVCNHGGDGGGCSVASPHSAIAFGMVVVGAIALASRRRKR